MSTADQGPISLSAAMRQGDRACMDSLEPASNPCSACNASVRGLASPSFGGRYSGQRSGACRSEAAHLEIEISGVQSVAEGRRRLSRSFESQHTLVPGDTRQTVSFLPSLGAASGTATARRHGPIQDQTWVTPAASASWTTILRISSTEIAKDAWHTPRNRSSQLLAYFLGAP